MDVVLVAAIVAPSRRSVDLAGSARETLPQSPLAGRAEAHDTASRLALRPAERIEPLEQRGADRAREMVAAHAPVEAKPAGGTARVAMRFGIDAERGTETLARRGELQAALAMAHESPLLETLEHEDPELAREVVVADARLAQRRLARARLQPHGARAVRHAHHALQQLGDVVVGEAEVAVASLALDRDEAAFHEFRQMCACGLLGDVGHLGELGCGERLAAHQCREDVGARTVADERRDADDVRSVLHAGMLSRFAPARFGAGRTIAVAGPAIVHACPSRASSATASTPSSARPSASTRAAGSASSRAAEETCAGTGCRTRAPTTSPGA